MMIKNDDDKNGMKRMTPRKDDNVQRILNLVNRRMGAHIFRLRPLYPYKPFPSVPTGQEANITSSRSLPGYGGGRNLSSIPNGN
jgi:hypothetical protein